MMDFWAQCDTKVETFISESHYRPHPGRAEPVDSGSSKMPKTGIFEESVSQFTRLSPHRVRSWKVPK